MRMECTLTQTTRGKTYKLIQPVLQNTPWFHTTQKTKGILVMALDGTYSNKF